MTLAMVVTIPLSFPTFLWSVWALGNLIMWWKTMSEGSGPFDPTILLLGCTGLTALITGFLHLAFKVLV